MLMLIALALSGLGFVSTASAQEATVAPAESSTQAAEIRADLAAYIEAKNWPKAFDSFQRLVDLQASSNDTVIDITCAEWGSGFFTANKVGNVSVALARARNAQTAGCQNSQIQANIDGILNGYGLVEIRGRSLTYNTDSPWEDGKLAQIYAATTVGSGKTFTGLLPVVGNNAEPVQYTLDGETFTLQPMSEHPDVQRPLEPKLPKQTFQYGGIETMFSVYAVGGVGSNPEQRLSASWQVGGTWWLRPLGNGSVIIDARLGGIGDSYLGQVLFEGSAGIKWEDSFHLWRDLTVTPMSGISAGWGSFTLPCTSGENSAWCGPDNQNPYGEPDFSTRLTGPWVGPELGGNLMWQTMSGRFGLRVIGSLEVFPTNQSVISVTGGNSGRQIDLPLEPSGMRMYVRPMIWAGFVVEFNPGLPWKKSRKELPKE